MRSASETRKMARYLAIRERGRPGCAGASMLGAGERPSTTGRSGSVCVARASGGVMAGAGLLEDTGDDLLERRLFHADVGDGVAIEDGRQDRGDLAPPDLHVGPGPLAAHDLAEPAEVLGG